MRRALMILGLAAVVAAPSAADAGGYCGERAHDRRVAGTVLGGVGGALIGQAISHDATGTVLGGIGGAVVGNQVARTSCDHSRARYSRGRAHRRAARYREARW